MRRFFEGLHLPQPDAVLRPVRVALPYKARKGRRIQDVLDGVVVVVVLAVLSVDLLGVHRFSSHRKIGEQKAASTDHQQGQNP